MDEFGAKMRQARERRGISLRQIAFKTKIAPASLDALERDDISRLPGGIFSRAFVRAYAEEVGLDPDRTVQEFIDRFNQEPAPTAASIAAAIPAAEVEFEHRRRSAARTLRLVAVAIPVVVVIAYLLWRGRSGQPPATAAAPASTAASPSPPR